MKVYNFEVERTHTYCANGILVHSVPNADTLIVDADDLEPDPAESDVTNVVIGELPRLTIVIPFEVDMLGFALGRIGALTPSNDPTIPGESFSSEPPIYKIAPDSGVRGYITVSTRRELAIVITNFGPS